MGLWADRGMEAITLIALGIYMIGRCYSDIEIELMLLFRGPKARPPDEGYYGVVRHPVDRRWGAGHQLCGQEGQVVEWRWRGGVVAHRGEMVSRIC